MTRYIKLNSEDVVNFVNITSKCDFDIDISYNSYVVDAKSFLGVYGLDHSKPLKIVYDGYNEAFENFIAAKAAAC